MDNIKINDLFESVPSYLQEYFDKYIYPWELLPRINAIIENITATDLHGYRMISRGIFVHEDVKIHHSAEIIAPAVIGRGTEIRPSAFLRGNVIIGENCVIGNSSELKNCILLDGVQVPHYNYVGDSILGRGSHLGAGTICSNLKSDKRNVVIRGEGHYETGLRKVGAFLGDGADIGCSSVLNPGTVVGKNTSVYPMTSLRGVYPPNSIVKSKSQTVERRP